GLAFLSTGLHDYLGLPSFSNEPGKMYVLDLLHPKPTPVELQIKGELDLSSFNPHGISVYTNEADDSIYLFVVNHPQQKSQVEIFRFVGEDTLVHLKTVAHPLLIRYLLYNKFPWFTFKHFYATNDRYFSSTLHLLTVILSMPWCNIVYYSPEEVREAAGGIQSGNGINISPDKRYIYVSDILDHEVDVFERLDGEQLSVPVGTLCDNIEVDHMTGDVWLCCHPDATKLSSFDPKDPPGSEIIKIKNIVSDQPVVTLEYGDDGHELMGSTVAAPYEGKLLIGTIFHKALYCALK
uniref:Paraoxonase n=1 Tax=Xiphophorus couchianus TaxID=32473 RepID=A0A3B5KMG0_9TELE